MELALYAPGAGYYTSPRDPFGKHGDFYTAEQLQPVFGILLGRLMRAQLQRTGSRSVLELGAGRGEMAAALQGLAYFPVEPSTAALPEDFRGVIFANEFFDALPVHLVERRKSGFREMRVTMDGGRFVLRPARTPVSPAIAEYLARYHAGAPVGAFIEVNLRALAWIERISRLTERGVIIVCDYGYTAAEWPRFQQGTLMSYRRHTASELILADPGHRDITAHVAWTPLQDALRARGWLIESFETLALALLRQGEADQFAALFADCDASEERRRRMQLKTLLFGMGETFRVLVASRNCPTQ